MGDVPLRDDPKRLFTRPSDLERHVRLLRRWGYTLVPFGALARLVREGRARAHAALTFDDGFADNLTTLLPLLQALRAPATVFVVSGWLGELHPSAPTTRLLTRDELGTLAAAPEVEIGAHTETHPDLTAIGREQIAEEFLECKRKLEDATGRLIEVAAYPYGRATDEAVSACSAAGFAAACLSGGRGSWLDAYRLPREDMDNRCTITGLRLKRTGRYEPLVATPPGAALRRAVRVFRSLGG